MIKIIDVKEGVLLKDYDLYATLALPLRKMLQEVNALLPGMKNRKIWMINSTEKGGGVAEMMPRMVSLFRQIGLQCDWVVAGTDQKEFFNVTKKLHNLIHGEAAPLFAEEERELYEKVNETNAEQLLKLLRPDDIVVINDPQPMGMAKYIKERIPSGIIWRCHIGTDTHSSYTHHGWEFLRPYEKFFSRAVFSSSEYIPEYFEGRSEVIYPGIDPLDHKNRDLPVYKIVGILSNSSIVTEYHPVLTPPFSEPAKRLQFDGSFQSPLYPSDMGILFHPVILQISRWDRLKGFLPLMQGFVELKKNYNSYAHLNRRHKRRLELARLVLAGPDPDYVEDDPEGREVLNEIIRFYLSVHPSIQKDIVLLKLPMSSSKNNKLIVNALQRVATVVVQNSLKEGFGLTVTEALWKYKPVLGTKTCGIREQIRSGLDGLLIEDPCNPIELANKMNYALAHPKEIEVWGYQGQKQVIEHFLIFSQVRKWIRIFSYLN